MGRKAKHHYIPKCYLKGFTEGGENSSQFWCAPCNNDAPFLTTPNDACSTRDYYTVHHSSPLIVEDWYAEKIEPKISEAIRHIQQHSSLPPVDEMQYLILLLATLYLRVPSFRASLEIPIKRTKEIANGVSEDLAISNIDEFNYSQTDLIRSELRLIDTVLESLWTKYYQLHVIDDLECHAITSDKPFVLSHPKGRKGAWYGLNTPDTEICVPITRKCILIAKNENIGHGTYAATRDFVAIANTKLALSARRFFFSSNPEVLLVDDDFSAYKHKIGTNIALEDARF